MNASFPLVSVAFLLVYHTKKNPKGHRLVSGGYRFRALRLKFP
jgi:hypothetical protein